MTKNHRPCNSCVTYTCTLFGSTSASSSWFNFWFWFRFWFWFGANCAFFDTTSASSSLFGLCFLYNFYDANCVFFVTASATASCNFLDFFNATCVGFASSAACASASVGCVRTRRSKTTDTQQPSNSQTGKNFFEIPALHVILLKGV